jgi:hypothetical protein
LIADLLGALLDGYPSLAAVLLAGTAAIVVLIVAVERARGGAPSRPALGGFARLVRLATAACVAVLGTTALVSVWASGSMHGWPLLAHVVTGGTLTALLAVFALTWAGPSRRRAEPAFRPAARLSFSLLLLFGLLAAASMLLSTFPLFGTQGLERLLDLHRFAGLGLCVATALHLALARPVRRGAPALRRDPR